MQHCKACCTAVEALSELSGGVLTDMRIAQVLLLMPFQERERQGELGATVGCKHDALLARKGPPVDNLCLLARRTCW